MMNLLNILLGLLILLILVLAILIWLLPTIIAYRTNHRYKVAIAVTNVLGSIIWGIGWLVALIWCFIHVKEDSKMKYVSDYKNKDADKYNLLEKIHTLKEKGILTEEEFNQKKEEILEG